MAQKPDRLEWRLAHLFTVSHTVYLSQQSTCLDLHLSVPHNCLECENKIPQMSLRETMEFPYLGKDLGIENAKKTLEQGSGDHIV